MVLVGRSVVVLIMTVCLSVCVSTAEIEELTSKNEAIVAERTKGDTLVIYLPAGQKGAQPTGLKMFKNVAKRFPENSASFFWSMDSGVRKRYMDEGREPPFIMHISYVNADGERLKKKKRQNFLRLGDVPPSELDKDANVVQSIEAFLLRQTIPLITQFPGDQTPDNQARFSVMQMSSWPKMYTFTNTKGTPEILTLVAETHATQLLSAFVHIDSIAAARQLLPIAGFTSEQVDETWERIEEGEMLSVIVDPMAGRVSDVHEDLSKLDLFVKDFVETLEFPRTPFMDKKSGKKSKKLDKQQKKKKQKKKIKKKKTTKKSSDEL